MTHQQTLYPVEQTDLTKDDYYTPEWIFTHMGLTFDIDVAAPPGGVPWIPTRRYFTMADDGLSQPWNGLVWCNPPFSNAGAWARRMAAHDNGVLLTCISKAAWVSDVVSVARLMWIPRQGLDFIKGGDEAPERYIPWQVMVVAFGKGAAAGLHRLSAAVPGALLVPA